MQKECTVRSPPKPCPLAFPSTRPSQLMFWVSHPSCTHMCKYTSILPSLHLLAQVLLHPMYSSASTKPEVWQHGKRGFLQLHLTATEFMLNIFREVFLLGSRHGKWSLNWVLICLGASVEWGEPVRRGKVPRRTKIGNVTFVSKRPYTSSQGLSPNLVITDVFARHNPIPPSTSGKALPSCQHTHGGPWLALSEIHQLPRSPPVPCQNWPWIANASLLADHPHDASVRIYCATRSPAPGLMSHHQLHVWAPLLWGACASWMWTNSNTWGKKIGSRF